MMDVREGHVHMLIEGTGKVCGLSWPQEGPPGSEWNWAKQGLVLQETVAAQLLS